MKSFQLLGLLMVLLLFDCKNKQIDNLSGSQVSVKPNQYITILGVAQDAGYPQIDCGKTCCNAFYDGHEEKKLVSCLGLVDLENNKKWIFDATTDITQQLKNLRAHHLDNGNIVDGIFFNPCSHGALHRVDAIGQRSHECKRYPCFCDA